MTIESYIPTEILRPFINKYIIIESKSEIANRVLPNTSLTMAFRFKGVNFYNTGPEKNELPKFAFSGLRKTVQLINYLPNTSTLVVLFKECGASALFKDPIHELFERSISLDNFIQTAELTQIEDKLADARTNSQRVAIIEQLLIHKLIVQQTDKLILESVRIIHNANGFLKISELANSLCISQDAFEKRFRRLVGATPKQFSSIVRMASIVRSTPSERFLDLAFDRGYYDQSHFNKDFKSFTGLTPTQFYNSSTFW
ncbi:helix-turn-helix transcriptional regulator [Hymenobacter sp. BT664]|uniref:Helix-turn-helix transcriptional regulator n=1 Tax=Hymenobacter montanus TaxID=2771359 RepID=A0A927BC55_9BACT|nr:helix-turn-helix transcriptional regulator [Hymenobacter montanus]MBD2767565.1 helix-turn-helix transcriptional regulator [Hymenobacter montanus]